MDRPKSRTKRMGEVLIELGLIDEHRLNHALKVSKDKGYHLGETLVSLGYIEEDSVLEILTNLTGVKVLDMTHGIVKREAQTLMDPQRMREMMVVPLRVNKSAVETAFIDPLNYVKVENVKFITGRNIIPILASRYQVVDILNALDKIGYGKHDLPLSMVKRSKPAITISDMNADRIFSILDNTDISDLHISIGVPPAVRKRGRLVRLNMPAITQDMMDHISKEIFEQEALEELEVKKEVELSFKRAKGGRFRVNAYKHGGGSVSIVIRRLEENIPSYKKLGIPDRLIKLLDRKGLLIVSSQGGHGKGSTIAALVDHINSTQYRNIITFEDPVEYMHHHKLSNVNQREIGKDTPKNTEDMFENVFKHDPDVIVFSDIRDTLMAETAIRASQRGILVIIGVNAVDTTSAVEQLVATMSDRYLKTLFVKELIAVFAQRLVARGDESVLIWEMLLGTSRVGSFIRDNKTCYLKGHMHSLKGEFFPMEESLAVAIRQGKLDKESVIEEPWVDRNTLKVFLERA